METRELFLIAFTLLAQLSVGSFLALGIIHYFASRKVSVEEVDQLSDRSLLTISIIMALSLVTSLFHLGNPIRAYLAVSNLSTSWLSREILLGVIFAILGALFTVMQWRKIASFAVRNVIAWLAALVGLALVYSMSRIYMLPTQPAWNTWATPVTFFTTTFLLGALAMGVAFVANYAYIQRKTPECAEVQCMLMRDTLRWIAIASVVLLGVELVVLPIYLISLASGPAAAVQTALLIAGPFNWALILRLVLLFVGAGIFALFLYQNALSPGQEKVLSALAYSAFVLVLAAEVLGRFLFYATHVRIGI